MNSETDADLRYTENPLNSIASSLSCSSDGTIGAVASGKMGRSELPSVEIKSPRAIRPILLCQFVTLHSESLPKRRDGCNYRRRKDKTSKVGGYCLGGRRCCLPSCVLLQCLLVRLDPRERVYRPSGHNHKNRSPRRLGQCTLCFPPIATRL